MIPRAWAFASLLLALSCAGAPRAAADRTTVLSLERLESGDPGVALARRLRARRGIHVVRFDLARAELTVVASSQVDVLAEARALKDEEYAVVAGPGRGSYVAWTSPPAGTDVRTIARNGEDVPELAAHVAPGKITVFDFSATWCEPCRLIDTHLLGVLVSRRDVAYRKLEIVDWDSPLARHYLKGDVKLPYVVVMDPTGKTLGVVSGLDLDRLDRLLGPTL